MVQKYPSKSSSISTLSAEVVLGIVSLAWGRFNSLPLNSLIYEPDHSKKCSHHHKSVAVFSELLLFLSYFLFNEFYLFQTKPNFTR